MYIFADKTKKLILGRQGENIVTAIKFPVAHWVAEFGAGTFELLHRRPKDVEAAPVVTTYDDDYVVWTISEADVQYRGEGNAQLVMRIGDAVAKSEVFTTVTLVSLSESENPPEVWRAWVDQVLAAAADAKDAVTKYPRINAANHWEIWSGGAWVDTGVTANGKDGEDGHTPIITASKQDKTTTVYVDGGQIATINDGKDGTDGNDGHTPIMTGEKVGDVNTIYADGVPLISVEDGAGEEITHDAVINAIGYTPAEENAFTETRDKLDALWKLSEGRVYDIVEQEENGAINPPSGAKYATLEDVRGNTTQESTNGYQLINYTYIRKEIAVSGILYTANDDGSVKAVGTSEKAYASFQIHNTFRLPKGSYVMSMNDSSADVYLQFSYNVNGTGVYITTGNGQDRPFVLSEDTTGQLAIVVPSTGTVLNNTFKPMIEAGTTAHPYEPYTGGVASPNPDYPQEIVSVDSFEVKHIGKNLLNVSADEVAEKPSIVNFEFTSNNIKCIANTACGQEHFFLKEMKLPTNVMLHTNLFSYIQDPNYTSGCGWKFLIRTYDKNGEQITEKNTSFVNGGVMYWTKYNTYYKAYVLKPMETVNNSYVNVDINLSSEVDHVSIGLCLASNTVGVVGEVKDVMICIDNDLSYEPYTVKAERTITPPRPLNRIGDYFDKADIENGVWSICTAQLFIDGVNIKITYRSASSGKFMIPSSTDIAAITGIGFAERHIIKGGIGSVTTNQHLSLEDPTQMWMIIDGISNIQEANEYLKQHTENIVYARKEKAEEPINASDLEFLRSLENLPASDNIIITDNHGRNVSYLVEYIRKLSEVN